jgi:hypothetical protein
VLWAGNWLFEAVGTYEEGEPRDQRDRMVESINLIYGLSDRRGVCVFPPLEFVFLFFFPLCGEVFDRFGFLADM